MAGVGPLRWLFVLGLFWLRSGSCQFHFISLSKSYAEAKSYCRESFTDLATVHNTSEMDLIISISKPGGRAWIGLELGSTWTWHWSEADHTVDFFNWRAGEPQNANQDRCAAMDPEGGWFESDCDTRRSFVCHGGASPLFVANRKSWRNAQTHCRKLSLDLVSIHSAAQNQAVRSITENQIVWTGLFKDAWTWSDGSSSAFRFWKTNQPNYLEDQDCVVTVLRNDKRWNDLKCRLKLKFFCEGPSKGAQTTAQPSTQTKKGPTTETTQRRQTSVVDLMSVPTSVPTAAPPPQQSTTSLFTPQARTVVLIDPPTLFNATTTSSGVSAPQLPTVPVTADVNSSVSTYKTTRGQTSHAVTSGNQQSSAGKLFQSPGALTEKALSPLDLSLDFGATSKDPPEDLRVLAGSYGVNMYSGVSPRRALKDTVACCCFLSLGKYILIQKTLTWLEALSYCRDHHRDLADITTKSAEDRVADMSRNATTAHVWLGLRYTCKFQFWFWTSSASLCYHNWGPGQGSGADYECGVTGAIEATGRQQWVGLPETRKLNFICSVCL